jgi:hypothetical protein
VQNSVRGLPLAGAEKVALDEYLLTLLLHHHPHNYSEELARTVPTLIPRAVRRAERFLIDNAGSPITVSDVAHHLGISLRSLQTSFRQWRETTLSCVLAAGSIGACARQDGFSHLGRFSAPLSFGFRGRSKRDLASGPSGIGAAMKAPAMNKHQRSCTTSPVFSACRRPFRRRSRCRCQHPGHLVWAATGLTSKQIELSVFVESLHQRGLAVGKRSSREVTRL